MTNKTRRLLKYATDVLINPGKILALTFKPVEVVVSGCTVFAIAELLHCSAHIKGAWDKYQAGKKSLGWMISKIGIKAGRLICSLIGAIALSAFTILASSALAGIFYVYAFIASSVFSTLHKVRGLYDHCTKTREAGMTDQQYKSKRNGLIARAGMGIAGTGLSVAVVLKVAFVVALIANPLTFWAGVAVFTGMALWKAKQAYKEYKNPKHPEKDLAVGIAPHHNHQDEKVVEKEKKELLSESLHSKAKSLPLKMKRSSSLSILPKSSHATILPRKRSHSLPSIFVPGNNPSPKNQSHYEPSSPTLFNSPSRNSSSTESNESIISASRSTLTRSRSIS